MEASKGELTVNFPARKKPKKPRQQAAQNMVCEMSLGEREE